MNPNPGTSAHGSEPEPRNINAGIKTETMKPKKPNIEARAQEDNPKDRKQGIPSRGITTKDPHPIPQAKEFEHKTMKPIQSGLVRVTMV